MSLEAKLIFGNGLVVDHEPSADIARGKIVHRGNGQLGIAHVNIDSGVMGGLTINHGVYELPKKSGQSISVGDSVYWDFAELEATLSGGMYFGKAVEAAGGSATHVRVTFTPDANPQAPVSVRVDSGTVIDVGDMIFLDTDDAKNAEDFTWDTNIATTQASFAEKFLGVAMQASADGETDAILVDASGESIYEFTVDDATYEVGDPLGPDKDTGDNMLSQVLEGAVAGSSVARAREFKSASSTVLKVSFASVYHPDNTNGELG